MKHSRSFKNLLFTRIFFCTSSLMYIPSTGNAAKNTRNPFAFRNQNIRKILGQGEVSLDGAQRKNIVIYELPDEGIKLVEVK